MVAESTMLAVFVEETICLVQDVMESPTPGGSMTLAESVTGPIEAVQDVTESQTLERSTTLAECAMEQTQHAQDAMVSCVRCPLRVTDRILSQSSATLRMWVLSTM